MSHVTPLGEDTRKPVPHFLRASPQVPFPFADLALYPLTVVSHSREDWILGPVSLPSK